MDNNETPTASPDPIVSFPVMVTDFRSRLDRLINSICLFNGSAEITLAKRSMQLGFSWLGEALKASGSQSPYVESENPNSEIIEPLADHSNYSSLFEEFSKIDKTQTARVKMMRAEISSYLEDFDKFMEKNKDSQQYSEESEYEIILATVISHASVKEAKIWFGWELGRIRKEKEFIANPPQDDSPGNPPLPL